MADDQFEYLLAQLTIRSRRGDRAEALCPAHDDRESSLSIARGTDQPVVIKCHAGCSPESVVLALGLTMADLGALTSRRVRSYYYTDASGRIAYSVERWVPKKFLPRLPNGDYGRPAPVDEVLFNLPAVLTAKARGERVYLVEGERDVETLREHGYVGTTAMSGASQAWLPQFSEALAGANVTIVADNDAAGRARARRVQQELEPYARSVGMMVPRYGKDVSDLLLAGFGIHVMDTLSISDEGLQLHSYDGIMPEPVSWAWDGWIPAGMFTLIEGDPGEGKSVLTVDLAARWTIGLPMPDGTPNRFGEPVNVAICSAEDDSARVILPRFLVAGGNTKRLFEVSGPLAVGTQARMLDLELDLALLRTTIELHGLRVLILDPLMAMLGSTRTNIDSEVRKILTPLRYLAEETRCTIIAVRHLRKQGGKPVHAGGGSIAFTGAARSVIVVGRNPHDDNERVMAIAKNNLGPLPTSQAYALVADLAGGISAPKVRWVGDSPLLAADLFDQLGISGEVRAEVTEEVVRLLGVEAMTFADIRKRLLLAGVEHGEKTLRSVLKNVAVAEHHDTGTKAHRVVYRLRSQAGLVPPLGETELDGTQEVRPSSPNPEPVGTSDTGPNSPDEGSLDLDGTPVPGTQVPSSSMEPYPHQLDGTQEVRPSSSEWIVACSVCNVPTGVLFYDDINQWRCDIHNPITGGGQP